jgi:hypothetical protein
MESAYVMMDIKEKIVLYLYAIVMGEENVSTIKNAYVTMVSLANIVKRLFVQIIVIKTEFVSKESVYVSQAGEEYHVI